MDSEWNRCPDEWRPVKGWEGYYEVNREGEIRSTRKSGYYFTILLKPVDNQKGYKVVHLSRPGCSRMVFVHRAVAYAFLGEPPEGKTFINHKDENPANNHIDNLEWCDAKYNCNYGTGNQRRRASFRRTMEKRKIAQQFDNKFNKDFQIYE